MIFYAHLKTGNMNFKFLKWLWGKIKITANGESYSYQIFILYPEFILLGKEHTIIIFDAHEN
jgi:hypothetical protein